MAVLNDLDSIPIADIIELRIDQIYYPIQPSHATSKILFLKTCFRANVGRNIVPQRYCVKLSPIYRRKGVYTFHRRQANHRPDTCDRMPECHQVSRRR